MIEIFKDKMGVWIWLYGDDFFYVVFLVSEDWYKGIIEGVFKLGCYLINVMMIDCVMK